MQVKSLVENRQKRLYQSPPFLMHYHFLHFRRRGECKSFRFTSFFRLNLLRCPWMPMILEMPDSLWRDNVKTKIFAARMFNDLSLYLTHRFLAFAFQITMDEKHLSKKNSITIPFGKCPMKRKIQSKILTPCLDSFSFWWEMAYVGRVSFEVIDIFSGLFLFFIKIFLQFPLVCCFNLLCNVSPDLQ